MSKFQNQSRIRFGIQLACTLAMGTGATVALAADLQDYAAACNLAIQEPVQAFSCTDPDTSFELPMHSQDNGETCEKPPYLPGAGCFAGSRIGQQVTRNDDVDIVFMCRKKRDGNAAHQFDDIAVIQTNKSTGQTCFYQRLVPGTDGRKVPAPTDPSADMYYLSPSRMSNDDNSCVQCHDGGPFLRTPYVMQAKDHIRAFNPGRRNPTHYSFPGNKWVNWNGKVFRAEVEGDKTCSNSTCHIMGVNTIDPTVGTSALWGRYATGAIPSRYFTDPESQNGLAHWMKRNRDSPHPDDIAAARRLHECAKKHDAVGCKIGLWGGQLDELLVSKGKYSEDGERVRYLNADDNPTQGSD